MINYIWNVMRNMRIFIYVSFIDAANAYDGDSKQQFYINIFFDSDFDFS